jgi:hypothetical protein
MLASFTILAFIFAFSVMFRELRQNKKIFFSYLLVVTLHQIIAFTNAYYFTIIGADTDASSFNKIGCNLAESGVFTFGGGSIFYENLLGVAYWLLGCSLFLGEQLSVFAFALSCVVLIKILRQLNLLRYQAPILIAFGALPTMVIYGSITLRESFQVLFFMLAVYFGIKMHLKGVLDVNFLLFILSVLAMGLFHKGLFAYMFFLVILFMVFSIKPSCHLWCIKKRQLLLFLFAPIIWVGLFFLVKLHFNGLGPLTAIINVDVFEYISNYRMSLHEARATYGLELCFSSPLAFFPSVFMLYLYYLFLPFPWQIENILDIYASGESILRFVLLYYSVKNWWNAYGVQRRLFGLMLAIFFSMSFLWALGTNNYGTAMRHNMLTWWILVVLGMPLLIDVFHRFFSKVVVKN